MRFEIPTLKLAVNLINSLRPSSCLTNQSPIFIPLDFELSRSFLQRLFSKYAIPTLHSPHHYPPGHSLRHSLDSGRSTKNGRLCPWNLYYGCEWSSDWMRAKSDSRWYGLSFPFHYVTLQFCTIPGTSCIDKKVVQARMGWKWIMSEQSPLTKVFLTEFVGDYVGLDGKL